MCRGDRVPVPVLSTHPSPKAADLPQGQDKVRAVRTMFDTIAPRYDLVNRVMTFGLDRGWRKSSVSSLLLPPGSKVLDLACGTGDLCRDLEAAGMDAVGVDLSMGMLSCARIDSPVAQADALQLPFPDRSFDGVVSGFALRNFVALHPVLAELARVTRPGGRMALLDVSTPDNAILRRGHAVYFGHVVPRIGGLLSDRAAYAYLPKSVAYLPSTGEMLDLIGTSGFNDVRRRLLSGGITQLLTATRLGSPT